MHIEYSSILSDGLSMRLSINGRMLPIVYYVPKKKRVLIKEKERNTKFSCHAHQTKG